MSHASTFTSGKLGADIPDSRGRTGLDRAGRGLSGNPDIRVKDVQVVSDGWGVPASDHVRPAPPRRPLADAHARDL